jgi:hypothetical protein
MQLEDCLSSLFALELMAPGPVLYLVSPWLSDVILVTNRFGQFRAVMTQFGQLEIGLASLLSVLSERGTLVRILSRPGNQLTEDFLRKLPPTVECKRSEHLHEKGLITEHFYLRGSMNITHFGVYVNDESVELTTEPDQVALAIKEAEQRWETI